jgi:hypothetical protein
MLTQIPNETLPIMVKKTLLKRFVHFAGRTEGKVSACFTGSRVASRS